MIPAPRALFNDEGRGEWRGSTGGVCFKVRQQPPSPAALVCGGLPPSRRRCVSATETPPKSKSGCLSPNRRSAKIRAKFTSSTPRAFTGRTSGPSLRGGRTRFARGLGNRRTVRGGRRPALLRVSPDVYLTMQDYYETQRFARTSRRLKRCSNSKSRQDFRKAGRRQVDCRFKLSAEMTDLQEAAAVLPHAKPHPLPRGQRPRAESAMPLLECVNLHKTFVASNRQVMAIDNLTLSVEQHEFVALVGPSGCGKSTFLHIVGGFMPASGGQLTVNGRSVSARS